MQDIYPVGMGIVKDELMPPSAVKTVRDLIYWQYAAILPAQPPAGR